MNVHAIALHDLNVVISTGVMPSMVPPLIYKYYLNGPWNEAEHNSTKGEFVIDIEVEFFLEQPGDTITLIVRIYNETTGDRETELIHYRGGFTIWEVA